MKIGRLEIILHPKAIDHPDHWGALKIKKMVSQIEERNPKSKIDCIKILRKLTRSYLDTSDDLKWGLKEQKEWIERNYPNGGVIY